MLETWFHILNVISDSEWHNQTNLILREVQWFECVPLHTAGALSIYFTPLLLRQSTNAYLLIVEWHWVLFIRSFTCYMFPLMFQCFGGGSGETGGEGRGRGVEGERAWLLLVLWQENFPLDAPLLSHTPQFSPWDALDWTWRTFSACQSVMTLHRHSPTVRHWKNDREAFSRVNPGTKLLFLAAKPQWTRGWRLYCTCLPSCWPGLVGVWVIRSPLFRRARERPADTGRTTLYMFSPALFRGAAVQNLH